MSDTSPQPTVEEQLAAFRAQRAASAVDQASLAQAEEDRCAALETVKDICRTACAPVLAALAEATDPADIADLQQLEANIHGQHAQMLEAAYAAFQAKGIELWGGEESESNPAVPGVETPLSMHVVVQSEALPGSAEPVA